MGLLDGLIGQVLSNAVGGQQQQPQNQDMLGGLLGSVLGGGQQQSQNSGLGGLLGSVVASQLGNNQSNGGLGGMLGSVLGAQQNNNVNIGNILAQVLGNQNQGGFNKNTLLIALIPVVLGFIQKNGGLSGVLNKFNGNGLGNKAQSWVALDKDNDGLDADDILGLFGQSEINQVCEQTGASQNDVCQGIADILPEVMNSLTPTGNIETDENEANHEISEILKQFGKS